MRKQTITFILFFLVGCQNKGEAPFLLFGDGFTDTPQFEFQYGNLEYDGEIVDNTNYVSFNSEVLCIHSLPISLYRRELGGKFRVCWKTNESFSEKWNSGFSLLENDSSEYPSWNLGGKGWVASVVEYGKWKKESDTKEVLSFWDSQIWSGGLVTYQTFALPHPIFIQRTTQVCEVVFPSHKLTGSENKQRTLVFELPCPDLGEIAERIETQNENWLAECDPTEPVVSELFRHSDSSYQRFIEWENPKDKVLCPRFSSIDWEIAGIRKTFQSELFSKRTKLILPNAILLLSDESKFHGIPIPKDFLADLGSNSLIRFGDSEFRDFNFFFRQGNEFFSNQTHSVSCRNQFNLWITTDNFCGNPGLPNSLEKKQNEDSVAGCKTDQIQITEFYPGNHFDSGMPIPGFFEFQNIGGACDGSSLNWFFENAIYPLSAGEWILPSGSIFLLTRKLWVGLNLLEKEKPFSLPKVSFQVPSFHFEDRKTKTTTSFLTNPDHFHLLRFKEKNRYSIQINLKNESPHPLLGSSPFFNLHGFQISPGQVNNSLVNQISTEILEYGSGQSPFLDFGFSGFGEGVVVFERENGNRYSFWKPNGTEILTFTTSPSPCNGEENYRLPDDFFSEPFRSLLYQNRNTGADTTISFDPNWIREKSMGGKRSLHPESFPIQFSRSLLPSPLCLGEYRSPGLKKERSLEIEKLSSPFTYVSNLPLDPEPEVLIGNGAGKVASILQPLGGNAYQWTLGPSHPFLPEEQIYSYFSHPKLIESKSFLERKGPVQIEAIYPNPYQSQNEWIYLCNRGLNPEDLNAYLVEDEGNTDELVSYQTRFPHLSPLGSGGQSFLYNSTILSPNGCAWIVDPDGKDWFMPIFQKESDLLLTVRTTATIGNGISSGESIQIRKKIGQNSILISSFGHKESNSPLRILVATGEFLWLKAGSLGMSAADFEIFRESL
ncbi:lamin tail domain-containing protein [Leptospira congkakensis]|uniref:Lamin tail domain-containing protein n=1 Tax=Leptospira congkakensis TaxID=2484932 RepID=A0A4Z1A692_9LEPT|nr:lamin tail domain-containing protein [Leptospira congkakensis]TGL90184.1 lamin tail domain-containing protein [Leptospira congkakensis]TGL91190.1 lamin tail domain-containing protein [Leptospira congkakensis]TGL98242.1 lamin tail domain-containing protein [Leptospira congkakensis]